MICNWMYVIFVIFQGKRIQLIYTEVAYGQYKCGCMVERRYNSLIFLWFLFISANFSFYILMISQWLKTKSRFRFCHRLLLKLSRVRRKRNKKAWFPDSSFHFQIFEISGYLEIDFSINFKQMFLNNDQFFWSYSTFLLKLWDTMKYIWRKSLQYHHTQDIAGHLSIPA